MKIKSLKAIGKNQAFYRASLIARGFGAAAFPSIAVRQELKRESLIMLSVENFSVTADYFLGYNDKRELSPAAFEFISLLTESMKPKDQI
ncbi:LysR substrate-binding domain-containing protein [Parasutterella sp.]|uniref:LysR substrate-binding domain-containing protein n=1 Tax=Parasutterella sp. TaxID=2049037 RepID=UPI003522129A